MSSSAREELYELAAESEPKQSSPEKPNQKEEVLAALNEFKQNEQIQAESQALAERRRAQEERDQVERQELQAVSESVERILKEEMKKDKGFSDLVEKSDLPGAITSFVGESAEPEEAPLIIRELANNDEFKEKLKNVRTQTGLRRLLGSVRKSVLTGGGVSMPPMAKRDIPQYDYNSNVGSVATTDYAKAALDFGI